MKMVKMMKIFLIIAMKNLYYMILTYVVCVCIYRTMKKAKDLHHLHFIFVTY
jgi:hypothetical protein